MENDIYAYLDSIHTTEVYNHQLPQDVAMPAVRFERVSYVPDAHMEGSGNCPQYRYQVDHYADTMQEAQTDADKTQALHARRGAVGTKQCVSFLSSERQDFIEQAGVFCVSADYIITAIN